MAQLRHRRATVGRSGVRLDSVALALSVGVSSALSFAVHAVSSRGLSVADYGGLAAVLALMTVAAVPIGAVQTALTRSASQERAAGRHPSGRAALAQFVPAALLLCGSIAVIAPSLAGFLDLPSSAPIAFGGVWAAVVLVGTVGKALLVAAEAHRPVAHAIVEGAVARLAAVAVLTGPFGVSGGIAAAVLGDLVSTVIYLQAARRRGLLRADGAAARVAVPDAGRALSAQLSLWLLASAAVIMGRRVLSGSDSGAFAAMATVASSCVFLPQAVATIVFPRFVADGSSRLLWRATALAAGVGTACAAALSLRPDIVFVIFFGPLYVPERAVLAILCAQFVGLGCLTVLSQYLVARRQAGVLSVWSALAVALVGAQMFGTTPFRLAVWLTLPTVAGASALAWRAVRAHPSTAPAMPEPSAIDLSHPIAEPATLDVTVVVPSYNGGAQLQPCVRAVAEALDATPWSYELIVAVDGSTDGSERTVADLGPRVIVDHDPVNRGKGAALRRGFQRARGELVGFIDGDGDIAPGVLVELVRRLGSSDAWAAVASKNHPAATVSASPARRAMSGAFRLMVHWMFDVAVSDTQCGCKVFRRPYLALALAHSREDGFALDLELLTIGSRLGLPIVDEVPVSLARVQHSTLSSRTAATALIDTVRLRRRVPQATWRPLPVATAAPVGAEFSSPLLP